MNGQPRRRAGALASLVPAALLVAGLGAGGVARAQDQSSTQTTAGTPSETPRAAPDPNAAASVGEVVVTARRQRETARDVPSTIGVVTAGQLAAQGPVSGTGDLLRTVPGVRFNNVSAPNLAEVSIRGSGTQRATGADSSVGLFFNGAYVGSSTLGGRNFKNVDFFDAERVEVLKGPQGALYGRNSEFGTINIVAAKPEFKQSGYVSETYVGGLDQNQLIGVANVPVTDELAVRVGAESFLQSGGFFKNTDTGDYYDHTDGFIVRGQMRYKHGPLDVNFLVDAQDLKLPVFQNAYDIPPGRLNTIPLGLTQDKFNIGDNVAASTDQRVQRGLLTVDYDLGWAKLTSTTLSENFHSDQNYGAAFDLNTEAALQSMGEVGSYPLQQVRTRAKDSELYEDFHGAGNLFNDRISWLLGAEAYYSRTTNTLSSGTSPCTLTATSGVCANQPGLQPACYQLNPNSLPCPAPNPLGYGTLQIQPQRYLSLAGYGLATFDIGYGLKLTGQLRYTTDDKHVHQVQYRLFTTTLVAPPQSIDFASDRTNYDVDLAYKIPSNWIPWETLFYIKTGTGYRAGGVNPGVSSPFAPVPFQNTYGNEDTTSYEAGIKGNITRHIYYTLNGYQTRTTNAIAAINDGCTVQNACKQGATVFNINAGTAAAHGVETTIQLNYEVLGGRANLLLSASDQRANYVAVRGTSTGFPLLNSPVAQQPDYTASAVFDYAHAVTQNVDGFLNVTWNAQWGGRQDPTSLAAPPLLLYDYDLVSLRAGVNIGRHVQVAFFVQNLLDQEYPVLRFQGIANLAPYTGTPYPLSNRWSQPRTYGVNAVYRW